MAELWDKFKTLVMGTPDDYDEDYDEYDDYDDEYDDYEETRNSKPRFDFMKNFRKSNDRQEPEEEERPTYRSSFASSRGNNVIDINAKVKMSVVVATPQSLEAASDVTIELRNKKTVIVNLEGMEKEVAQRITDFLSGSCYALGGSIQPISNRIYIIGPYDVAITGEFKEELAASGIKLPSSVFRQKRY